MTAISATNPRHIKSPPISNTKNVVNSLLVAGATTALAGLFLAAVDAGAEVGYLSPSFFSMSAYDFSRATLHLGEYWTPVVGAAAGIYNFINNS